MNPLHILHFLPAPARGVMYLILGAGLLVLILVVAVTRLPAAVAYDLAAVGRLAFVEALLALVTGFCMLVGGAAQGRDSLIGSVGLSIAAAGAVTSVLLLAVPLSGLQIGPEPVQDDPTFFTPMLECLCGPGVLFGGALVFARQWQTNRRKAEAAARDAEN